MSSTVERTPRLLSFLSQERHDIGSWPNNTTLVDSSGRGWRNLHAALVNVKSWTGVLPATGHPCLGYCVNRPAQLSRQGGTKGQRLNGTLRPRQFHLIPANEPTEWRRHGTSDMLAVHVRQELIDEVASQMLRRRQSGFSVDLAIATTDPLLEQIVLALLTRLRQPEDGVSGLYVDSLAHMLAAHLVQVYGGANRDMREYAAPMARSSVRHMRDVIEANLGDSLTVDRLAREAGLTPRAFTRAFRRQFGVPVHQFVLGRRLQRAKDLLATTDDSIIDVALQTGFSSQSHLSTAFRKLTGLTPGEFRRT